MTPLTEAEATSVGHAFDTHAQFIETVARRHSRAPQDVPDIVQSVGVQMCRKLRDFRGDASITTWLYRVTVNAAIDNWRLERQHLERVRESLLVHREGDRRRSSLSAADSARWADTGGLTRPVDAIEAVPPSQEDQVLERERAEGLHQAIGRLRPAHAGLLREELAGGTVIPSRKSSKHRARQRLREVLLADPTFG